MPQTQWTRWIGAVLIAGSLGLGWAQQAHARADAGMLQDFKAAHPELFGAATDSGGTRVNALPDIYGPGSVLNVGNCYMKITNYGLLGNPFTNLSNDPSLQWPGASGVEYLSFSLIMVGGVNPQATDPQALRRVSYFAEWRPPSLEPEDRIYRAYDGIIGGNRLVNDDGDLDVFTLQPVVDEDFLDGRDNDGDKKIDEDYAALGQLMFSCVLRDDTPAAINTVFNEKHIPLGLEIQQLAWAYSVPGFQDFNPAEFTVYNRSGHTIDSMYFGLRTDIDSGPIISSTYFSDDYDAPYFPQGNILTPVPIGDPQRQVQINPQTNKVDTLCARHLTRINGYSIMDDDGDLGKTPGLASLILLGFTTDPLGISAPPRVLFRAFRSHIGGTPYTDGGNPTIDQQRYEFMAGTDNVDQTTGDILLDAGDQKGDYQTLFSVGPFNQVPDGGHFQVTVAFAVTRGDHQTTLGFPTDRIRYEAGTLRGSDFFKKYPQLANAYSAQVAYDGIYETPRPGFEDRVPDCAGCETPLILEKGSPPKLVTENCPGRETSAKQVTDNAYTWFDFDCDYCTGVYAKATGQGYYLRHWNAESPPPNPNLNVSAVFNYSDNPERTPSVTPAGDHQVTVAWDNLSENTPDPKTNQFDFRAYRLWKVASWRRPVGASAPTDDDWALLAEYRWFDGAPDNKYWVYQSATESTLVCPRLYIPQRGDSMDICLTFGDLWDRQSGIIIHPDPSVDCVRKNGECVQDSGYALGTTTLTKRNRYPIGRYRTVDTEVQNGFMYFYSVTAGDSVPNGTELFGRRSASEADGVLPQASAATGKSVWVVPNPYRGYADIGQRPSSWDLVPNASDPTGTSIAFMGMPAGKWSIRIYTISGDLVQELHNDDPVNDSVRSEVVGADNETRSGYNRQQDNANDGQARWNLISRNGQDIVSGIYVFVVESDQGTQRGKFVVIR